jgi:hypothetical protein
MSTGDEFYAWFPDQEKANAFVESLKARLSGPGGTLREGDQLSTYAGVGASKEAAAAELVKAKAARRRSTATPGTAARSGTASRSSPWPKRRRARTAASSRRRSTSS